jgi:signal transduction histidine kinase
MKADAAHVILNELEQLLLGRCASSEQAQAATRAARRQAALLPRGDQPDALRIAATTMVADAVVALSVERPPAPQDLADVLEALERLLGHDPELARCEIGLRALRDPLLLEPPAAKGLDTALALLVLLGDFASASYWLSEPGTGLRCAAIVGDVSIPTRQMRRVAKELLTRRESNSSGVIRAYPVLRFGQPTAALVVRLRSPAPSAAHVLPTEAARVIGAVFAEQESVTRRADEKRALLDSAERRFARFAYDLHDGPIQDVIALVKDVRLFRDQIAQVIDADNADRARLLGRVDDVDARLIALDNSLRELGREFESPTLLRRPISEVLAAEVSAFRSRSGIRAQLEMKGEVTPLTPSQRIALVRIVQEALSNVRAHSRASSVAIRISMRRGQIRAEIEDDGIGFDVERSLARAARGGRLGLVGMSERVRLLGGVFDIESRTGGPTRIEVILPHWRPDDAVADAATA